MKNSSTLVFLGILLLTSASSCNLVEYSDRTAYFQKNPEKLSESPWLENMPLLDGEYAFKVAASLERSSIEWWVPEKFYVARTFRTGKDQIASGTRIRSKRVILYRSEPSGHYFVPTFEILDGEHQGKELLLYSTGRDGLFEIRNYVDWFRKEHGIRHNPEILEMIREPRLNVRGDPVK